MAASSPWLIAWVTSGTSAGSSLSLHTHSFTCHPSRIHHSNPHQQCPHISFSLPPVNFSIPNSLLRTLLEWQANCKATPLVVWYAPSLSFPYTQQLAQNNVKTSSFQKALNYQICSHNYQVTLLVSLLVSHAYLSWKCVLSCPEGKKYLCIHHRWFSTLFTWSIDFLFLPHPTSPPLQNWCPVFLQIESSKPTGGISLGSNPRIDYAVHWFSITSQYWANQPGAYAGNIQHKSRDSQDQIPMHHGKDTPINSLLYSDRPGNL